MQITAAVSPGLATVKPRGGEAIQALPGARRIDAPEAAPAHDTAAPSRGGLRAWSTGLNHHVAGAQQALTFLDELAGPLQGIKAELGSKLVACKSGRSPTLDGRFAQLNRSWRERANASGGHLDGRLRYTPGAPAAQRFTVRGLDLQALRAGDREMLSFEVGTSHQRPPPVLIEPGLSDEELVRRFDHALAGVGIRVSRGERDSLVFSTPEADWPHVRDTLAVKGGGLRFPTGRFNRVRTDAEPDVLQPQTWNVDDAVSMHQTLQQVLQAQVAARQARDAVTGALAEAGRWLDGAQPKDDALWARSFAAKFQTLGREPGYQALAEVSDALVGVRRDRVLSLLALR